MADALTQARAAGYTDSEIFAHLTKGREKELGEARAAGYNDTQILNFFLGKGDEQVSGVPDAELTNRRVNRAREQAGIENTLFMAEADPARHEGALTNFTAGFGKSFADTGRGVKQIGAQVADVVAPRERSIADLIAERDPSRAAAVTREIDEARRVDQPLMRTGAGTFGNVSGHVAQSIPLAFVPGANTIKGSTAIGALMGATQPVGTGESRLTNTGTGALAGAAGPVIARTVGAGYRAAKALTEPFTKAGRDRIAGRTLQKFGVTAADVANATDAPTATGARLTLPEQITRPEGAAAAARLQDTIRSANPEVAAQMTAREAENNAARVATLERMENMNGGRAVAEGLRNQTAKVQYDAAFARTIDPKALSAAERGEYTKIFNLPSVKDGMRAAARNMADKGLSKKVPQNSIEALHETKLAMDQAISDLVGKNPNATQFAQAQSIKMARDRLTTFIERHAPEYADARRFYAEMSRPINQADIAGEVLTRGSTNTTDLLGNRRLMAGQLTGAVADEAKLMKGATGRQLGDDLSKVMEPDQLAAIRAVVGEVDRGAAVGRAANGPGSATAQRLAGQNIIDQALSGTGIPQSVADAPILQELLARPLSFLYKGAGGPGIQTTLGEVLLNPAAANRVMAAIAPAQRKALANVLSNPLLKQAARASLPAAAVANRR